MCYERDSDKAMGKKLSVYPHAERVVIKPCPFCGTDPSIDINDFCYRINRNTPTLWRAGCIESAGGCGAEVLGESKKEATDMWNSRTLTKRAT